MSYVAYPNVARLMNFEGKYLLGMKGCFSACCFEIAASLLAFWRFLRSRLGTESERLSPTFCIWSSSKS
jgi:hypothetical protein